MKCKKGQLTYIVLILVAVSIVGGWIFLSYESGDIYQKKVITDTRLDKVSNYLELAKTYSKMSFIFSVNQALARVASLGGTTKIPRKPGESEWVHSWVCNGKKFIPSVDTVRYFLSEETNATLNIYISNLSRKYDTVNIYADNYTCVNYNVTESDVLSGKYDEGNFSVGCYGSKIITMHSNIKMGSPNDYYFPFYNIRFWKLYRGFRTFIESTNFNPCECIGTACQCHGNPCDKGCEPYKKCLVDNVVTPNVEKLNNIMNDKYIVCSGDVSCNYEEDGPSCIDIDACLPWHQPPCCFYCKVRKKKKACYESSYTEFKEGENVKGEDQQNNDNEGGKYNSEDNYNQNIESPGSCSSHKCMYWYEKRVTHVITFSCKDTKYYVSTPSKSSPEPLTFSISVTAAARNPKACKTTASCNEQTDPYGNCHCTCPLPAACVSCPSSC